MPLETEFTQDGWKFKRITPNCNHYAVFLEPTAYPDNALVMTGADVTKQLRIPFAHRINRIELTHLVAAGTLGTDALNVDFSCKQGAHDFLPLFESNLLAIAGSTASRITEVFGEAFEHEQRTWTLTLNSTVTDKIVPVIYVQLVGSGGYT